MGFSSWYDNFLGQTNAEIAERNAMNRDYAAQRNAARANNYAAAQFSQAQNKANQANEARYQEGLGIYDQLSALYEPGGKFGAGAMSSYQQGKGQAMASGMQSMVSSGLSNTTTAAGLGQKYESEVGTPFRLQLEDLRMSKYAGALQGKAGFIERRTDAAPNPALMR